MLSPPMPLPSVQSPPCSMKLGMTRWKMLPLLFRRGERGGEVKHTQHRLVSGDNGGGRALWALRACEASTGRGQTH